MNGHRENNFDFLRLAASVAVMFSHAFLVTWGRYGWEPLASLGSHETIASVAVKVFFIISGFLIPMSFERGGGLSRYVRARFLRIVPGLFVSILFCIIVLGPLVTTLPLREYFSDPGTFAYLERIVPFRIDPGLPGVFETNTIRVTVNGSLWTLMFEFYCYALIAALGVAGLLKAKYVLPFSASVYAVGTILHLTGRYVPNTIHFLVYFLAGSCLYFLRGRVNYSMLSVTIALAVVAVGLLNPACTMVLLPPALAYATLAFAFSKAVQLRNGARYGDLSYGIYIYAYPVQQAMVHWHGVGMHPLLNFVLAAPVVIVLAYLSWHGVEERALKLKRGKSLA